MKKTQKKFSKSWKGSKEISKQRKYRKNAPLHIKKNFFNMHLNKELREKYSTRSVLGRKGDKAIVLRGQFRKKEGKISKVDYKHFKVYVEGIEKENADGSKSAYPFNASNLMLTQLDLSDNIRKKKIENMKKKPEVKGDK